MKSAVRTLDLARTQSEARTFLGRASVFVLVGLVLYGVAYLAAERLVLRHAHRNRFFVVASRAPTTYDAVILGASHAAALDFRGMNHELEALTGARVLNLAVVGGGILVSQVLLDYLFTRHRTASVIYVLDSFAFYSSAWNERRLQDRGLFARAPFDPALASVLLRTPGTRLIALDYLSGFSKINNADRFAPDLFADETTRFDRVYRPVGQIDRQRVAYLYPDGSDPEVAERYLAALERLIERARGRGVRFVVLKPPVPSRVLQLLPEEGRFDAAVERLLHRHGVAFHDFSRRGNDEHLFYDTDHLNQDGVRRFFERALAPLVIASKGG